MPPTLPPARIPAPALDSSLARSLPQPQAEAPLYKRVEQRILGLINTGAVLPGHKAPSLRETAQAMGVSLATVVQAYASLEQAGVLESRPRSGFVVRQPAAALPPTHTPQAEPPAARPVRRGEIVRRVLETMGRSDILPLSVAQVDPALLPSRTLARLMTDICRRQPDKATDYAPVVGTLELRRQVARRLALAGVLAAPEELLTTCGATEGMSIALRTLTHPGDAVLIATPTYHLFLQMIELMGLRAVEIPSHPETGIHPADVAEALDRFDIAACVLTATWNNPDGSCMPPEAKAELVRLLASRNVPLVEDDVYGDLVYPSFRPGGTPRPPACKAFDEHGIVTLVSSFSKTLAPGYRVGYLLPGKAVADNALEFKGMSTLSCAAPTELAVAEYLERGLYDRHLSRITGALESQTEAMRRAVSRHFPEGTRATTPRGGCILWVELPPGGPSGVEVFLRAAAEGIGISPGLLFSNGGGFERFLRLSTGLQLTPQVEQAVARLGAIARGQ
ncbi:aminotransferase-like domain-containing protein [Megalodesulfovibrio paquesii]